MRCPRCGQADSRVVDTRDTATGIRRRRECLSCKGRFTTYEQLASQVIQVVKRDGRREDYDREKLLAGLRKACTKRPIPSEAVETIANQVEAQLAESGKVEVSSETIGQAASSRRARSGRD